MLPTILILAVSCAISAAKPEADPADDILRSEIESAAKESRALADELAAMLARLEAEDDRIEAVEAAVVGDTQKVKEALTEMVDKIEELAEASEDSNLSKLAGAVKGERLNEEELRKTLEELEIVATQIEDVASSADSSGDIIAIEKMAKLLQTVSDKVKEKTKNINVTESAKTSNEETKSTSLELNGIDEMIESLEKVTHDLRDLNVQSENENNERSQNLNKNNTIFIARQPKSLDLELNKPVAIQSVSEYDKEDDAEINSKREPKELDIKIKDSLSEQKEMKSSIYKKNKVDTIKEPGKLENTKKDEECTDNEVTNRVKVCVPKFPKDSKPVQLYSGAVVEERHCFDVTKTICEESSQIVSKEVCVYSYNQKTVVAPAQMTEVTFERRHERLGATKCRKEKILETGYKEKEVEVCKHEYVEAPFSLPSVAENINEFIDMSIPEPDKNCQTYKFEIPEVTCKDVTTRECTDLAYVDTVAVTEYLDTIHLDYKGKCSQRRLEQQQKVCIQEQKVQKPRQSYRG